VRLTFLGTGTSQGIPVIGCQCEVCLSADPKDRRLRSSARIEDGEDRLVIDCGPDFRYQMLRSGTIRLQDVLITHEHYDHTAGLDDLRPFSFIHREPVRIYAQPEVLDNLKSRFAYAFGENKYPGSPEFELLPAHWNKSFEIGALKIQPLEVNHGRLKILGYKIGEQLAYITDANGLPEETLSRILNIQTLVINALHHRPHHSHFTLDETILQIEKIRPARAWLIHMSHHMGLHEVINAGLPPHIRLAYDGLMLNLS